MTLDIITAAVLDPLPHGSLAVPGARPRGFFQGFELRSGFN